jgi:transglutaminase-like putative cysteine protease
MSGSGFDRRKRDDVGVPRRVSVSRRLRSSFLAICVLVVAAGAQAQSYYRFAAPAAWVDVATVDTESARAGVRADSTETLLLDRQINVTAAGDDYYHRLVTRVLNSAGVDEHSQIDFVVDPTYQSLDVHWLRIIRSGVSIDQKPTARISELAEETDLRNRVYNGRYTVNVLLSDVRPGDVIDYAFSIRSRENLFPGHFYVRLDLGWSVPVERQRVRILSPVGRALRYRSSDGSEIPQPSTRGGVNDLVMESRNLPGVPADGRVPGWYSQWPYLEAGDLPDWRDVVRRVSPLYRQRPRDGALVTEAVAAIRSVGGSTEQQALRALQWVQEEIRYTSVSIGRGSHEPTAPNAVIERRYGDCKDKSLLLVAMLDALGVEADVALVHSWRGQSLEESLPTPYAFDHVIVRARLGSSLYWLDPTTSTQLSPLAVERSPSFARALVLVDDAQDLEVIPKPGADLRQRDVSVVLDATGGVEAPATLDITTRYRDALADTMRSVFSSTTPEQRQNDYASYIARYYSTAKTREPLSVRDDREGNVLEVRESYSLDSAFVANAEGMLELTLHADELYPYADPLGAGSRQAPLALEYPIHVRQELVARLPESWPVTPDAEAVDNPAFRYRSTVRYASNTVTIRYDYQALDDHVAESDVARYEADRARMYDDLGYVLNYNAALAASGIPAAVAPLPIIVLLLTFVAAVWAAVALGYRYDPEPKVTDAHAPVGITGWLLLPALGVVASPLVLGWLAIQWLPLIGVEVWGALPTVVAEPFSSSARVVALALLSSTVALMVASALVLWLFVTKRTSAPTLFIAVEWITLAVITGFTIWVVASGLDEESDAASTVRDTIRSAISVLFWTAYMTSSRRVKATFVNRLRPKSSPAAAPAA